MNIDIHINIGSNSGHREALIERAVAAVSSSFPEGAVRRSAVIETPPWGFDSPNPFLNIGLAVRISVADETFLRDVGGQCRRIFEILQRIQTEIDPSPHRDALGGYIDRAIDIDLIAVGEFTVDLPELTLPHPRMHLRDFVLLPMSELDPTWRHPLLGKNVGELLESIPET